MTQIILEIGQPVVIEKLRHLAEQHHRTLDAEINAILESAVQNINTGGWSEGFFERTYGSWEGEPLEREPQPEYQEREPFL
jgi:hypothetical protein